MDIFLAILGLVLPILAVLLDDVASGRIPERHHSHHDTYTVPVEYTHAFLDAALVMGILGLMVAFLCFVGVFRVTVRVVLTFTDTFVVTILVLWGILRNYKVSVFDDHMVVTKPFKRIVSVEYANIERMEWHGFRRSSGYRNLYIWAGGRHVCTLWCMLDLEQILMRVDRFDALQPTLG